MEYRHFSNFKKPTKFSTLPGHIQRAIETQTNIDLEARKNSRYLAQSYQIENIQEYFFNQQCEKYANSDDNKLKELVILDSKYLYYFPLTKDRENYWENKAREQAQTLDRNIIAQMAEHYRSYD